MFISTNDHLCCIPFLYYVVKSGCSWIQWKAGKITLLDIKYQHLLSFDNCEKSHDNHFTEDL